MDKKKNYASLEELDHPDPISWSYSSPVFSILMNKIIESQNTQVSWPMEVTFKFLALAFTVVFIKK